MTRRHLLAVAPAALSLSAQTEPLRLGIAGLVHGHVEGFLRSAARRSDVKIVGLCDPDGPLRSKYSSRYGFSESIVFPGIAEMLKRTKPEAVAAFTNTFDHVEVAEACASEKLPLMMEKPLAVSNEHAGRIRKAAVSSGIPVVINYETTWYPSHGAIRKLITGEKAAGEIRRMVAMDGHQGPKEIGVGPEFLGWLTDPGKNGAGALFDFGCYGANLMTWMMEDARPLAVTASVKTMKPAIYGKVDDDATILVDYPRAQGVIEASLELAIQPQGFRSLRRAWIRDRHRRREPPRQASGAAEKSVTPEPLPADEADSISYLLSVVRGRRKPEGLSSLENNLIATEILVAARESARTGRRVTLARQ